MPVRRFVALALALTLAACGTKVPIQEAFPPKPIGTGATLAGTATYQEAVVLPDGAVLDVQLRDVSRPEKPAVTLGRGRTRAAGLQGNVSYSLSYDPSRIQVDGRYVMRARIEVGNQVLFVNANEVPVLAGDDRQDHAGRVNFAVRPAGPR